MKLYLMIFCFRDNMADCKKLPIIFLALLSIGLMSSETYGIAVMSVDIGSEWMKVAIVSVRFILHDL